MTPNKKPRSGEGKRTCGYQLTETIVCVRPYDHAGLCSTKPQHGDFAPDEKQARLDAIAAILETARKRGGGTMRPLTRCLAESEATDIEVLATGKPARTCAALVRKYGKEKR